MVCIRYFYGDQVVAYPVDYSYVARIKEGEDK
jgi:hypothetical protein